MSEENNNIFNIPRVTDYESLSASANQSLPPELREAQETATGMRPVIKDKSEIKGTPQEKPEEKPSVKKRLLGFILESDDEDEEEEEAPVRKPRRKEKQKKEKPVKKKQADEKPAGEKPKRVRTAKPASAAAEPQGSADASAPVRAAVTAAAPEAAKAAPSRSVQSAPRPARPEGANTPKAEGQKGAPKKTHRRKPDDPTRKKHNQINQILNLVLVAVSAVTIIALLINTVRVMRTSKVDNAGSENTLATDSATNSMKNDLYRIGNNPTAVGKEYFQKLTDAIKSGSSEEQAEAVVYNFVNDYFTWTNKDGNYEVGGLQYVFAEKYAKFEEWNRWYNYSNLDLYISQYGRENLPQVKEITTEVPTFRTEEDFTVLSVDPQQTYPCYQVQVAWTYESTPVNLEDFPNRMRFQVVDHNGRFEIVEFYDMPSVEEWEAKNGTAADNADGTASSDSDSETKTGDSEG